MSTRQFLARWLWNLLRVWMKLDCLRPSFRRAQRDETTRLLGIERQMDFWAAEVEREYLAALEAYARYDHAAGQAATARYKTALHRLRNDVMVPLGAHVVASEASNTATDIGRA